MQLFFSTQSLPHTACFSPYALPRSYSLSGSMEVAQLLHKMALADGIPTSQVHTCCPAAPRAVVWSGQPCCRPLCRGSQLEARRMWMHSAWLPETFCSCPTAISSPPPHPSAPMQLHLPGMSTSASFDDLLQSLMMAEMSTSL